MSLPDEVRDVHLAVAANCSLKKIQAWRKQGKLPPQRQKSYHFRYYLRSEIEPYIEALRETV